MPDSNNVTLATAQALATRKIYVFPCKPRSKVPATAHGLLDATVNPDIINSWWAARPDCNLAIACGAKSNLFVVDIDSEEGELELTKLELEHGALPATAAAITAKGRHLYFRHPGQRVPNSVKKILPGIDVRGDGGYAISPPSTHESGWPYRWSVDCADTIAAPPDWLVTVVCKTNSVTPAAPPSDWQALIADIPEGQRDVSLTRLCGYLLRHYVAPALVHDLIHMVNATRCRPPLPDSDVDRICNSIANKEFTRRNGHG
jgi:hypothetical protein